MRGKITLLLMLLVLATAMVTAEPRVSNLDVRTTQSSYGDVLHVSYTISDDRPLGRISTHTYLPNAIDHITVETAAHMYRYQESFLLPANAQGQETGFVRITPQHHRAIQQNFVVNFEGIVEPTTPPRPAQPPMPEFRPEAPLNIVISPEVPNVAQGEWVYWPITLYNSHNEPITVTLGVDGVRSWGTYRIDPQPTITVPAHGQAEAFMYIAIDHDAWTGLRWFSITAHYHGIMQERDVSLAVLRPAERTSTVPWWAWGVIALLILLAVLITLIVLLARRKDREDEDDFVTYY